MADEQNQAPAEQAPQAPAAPAAPQAAPTKPKGKSNGCVIAIIVVAVLLVLAIVAGYLGYRWVKSKVSTDTKSTSINIGGTQSSVSTSGDTYDTATEQNPTSDLIKSANNDLKPIFAKLYGGAKVNAWTSFQSDSGTLSYITKNKISSDSFARVEAELTAAGYSKTSNYSSSDGAVISASKGDVVLAIYLTTTDTATNIAVTIEKGSATVDTGASSDGSVSAE